MNKLKFAALAAVLVSGSALAEVDKTGFYVGGSLSQVKASGDGDGSSDGAGFGAYGGYNFNEWFGLESIMFVSGDLGEDGVDVGAGALTFTPKFTYHFNDTFSAYAKVGVASMALVVDYGSFDQDFTGVGLAWGVGINAALTENLNLRLSYDETRGDLDEDSFWFDNEYYNGEIDNVKISQVALGLHYQF
ncbi:outer membrane beta-barrel protein [Shewanella sp. JM162201]|uniref:Outer membrane beta-barrel protein n=1 Tax=Shewanella jiangmenensis TaxID=2837387 RepID=A0ABS5V467_9GAMM|nr:porin family protein [Shewanella jiangmenensis]MBT1445257.1 outer membrane beta-barrel protein [Shewanella jiangmenensis]